MVRIWLRVAVRTAAPAGHRRLYGCYRRPYVGLAAAVAPLGTALTEDQISLLWRMMNSLCSL